jgi:chromatin segregation and condensation protein Rec8/ScpA/Scc1 (kleisin family)
MATFLQLAVDFRIDVSDIPLADVCSEYFNFLQSLEPEAAMHQMDDLSGTLSLLALLVQRKAGYLLYAPEEEQEPIDDIDLSRSSSIGMFQPAIEFLIENREQRNDLYFRAHGDDSVDYRLPVELKNVSAFDLARTLERLLRNAKPVAIDLPAKPRPSLGAVMKQLLGRLTISWTLFDELLPTSYSKADVVYLFLALLELARIGQAELRSTEMGFESRAVLAGGAA